MVGAVHEADMAGCHALSAPLGGCTYVLGVSVSAVLQVVGVSTCILSGVWFVCAHIQGCVQQHGVWCPSVASLWLMVV